MTLEIVEASVENAKDVSRLVEALLVELEPESKDELAAMGLTAITEELLRAKKIYAFIAYKDGLAVGVLTLHECAAIYAGGLFGEISEMYVAPGYRSLVIGKSLVQAAITKSKALNWQRLEVGSPPPEEHKDTVRFYKNNNFVATGTRLKLVLGDHASE